MRRQPPPARARRSGKRPRRRRRSRRCAGSCSPPASLAGGYLTASGKVAQREHRRSRRCNAELAAVPKPQAPPANVDRAAAGAPARVGRARDGAVAADRLGPGAARGLARAPRRRLADVAERPDAGATSRRSGSDRGRRQRLHADRLHVLAGGRRPAALAPRGRPRPARTSHSSSRPRRSSARGRRPVLDRRQRPAARSAVVKKKSKPQLPPRAQLAIAIAAPLLAARVGWFVLVAAAAREGVDARRQAASIQDQIDAARAALANQVEARADPGRRHLPPDEGDAGPGRTCPASSCS